MKHPLFSLLVISMVHTGLYAQHTTSIFIQETSAIGFPKNSAADYVESELLITTSTRFTDFLSLELSSIIVDQGAADAVIGIGMQVTPNLRLIPAIGLANNSVNPLRLGFSSDYFSEKYTGMGIFKWGPETSYYYFYELITKIKKYEIGFRGERYVANGLHLGYNIKPYFLVFTSPGYDFEYEEYRVALGLAITFK